MEQSVERWEVSVEELWEKFDSLNRDEGIAAMRDLADACPAGDGRAAFELAGMYDSMGFESEAGTEYEQALKLGLDKARHAQLAVQYGSTLRNLGRLDEAIAVLSAARLMNRRAPHLVSYWLWRFTARAARTRRYGWPSRRRLRHCQGISVQCATTPPRSPRQPLQPTRLHVEMELDYTLKWNSTTSPQATTFQGRSPSTAAQVNRARRPSGNLVLDGQDQQRLPGWVVARLT